MIPHRNPVFIKWAADLKENHLHAILFGFFIGDTPGTFYDFLGRLWLSDKDNLSDPVHPPKEKPKKPESPLFMRLPGFLFTIRIRRVLCCY